MHEVFEKIFDVILIILCVGCCFGIISANNSAIVANRYLTKITNKISNSNISENVISYCEEDAINNGYTIEVDVVNEDIYGSRYADITLYYYYEIPLLKVKTEHTKTATAK